MTIDVDVNVQTVLFEAMMRHSDGIFADIVSSVITEHDDPKYMLELITQRVLHND